MNNGYKDPTAYIAINNVYKEEQDRAKAKRGIDLKAHEEKRKRINKRIRAVTYK